MASLWSAKFICLVNVQIWAFFWNLQNFWVFSVYRHFQLIHSLNKLPFEHLPACLIFLPEIKFALIAFDLGLIVLIKRGPLDPWWPFSKRITAIHAGISFLVNVCTKVDHGLFGTILIRAFHMQQYYISIYHILVMNNDKTFRVDHPVLQVVWGPWVWIG